MDNSEGIFIPLEELQVGDVVIGSNIRARWDREYIVTSPPDVWQRRISVTENNPKVDTESILRMKASEMLYGELGYKFHVKNRMFKYDPKQAGDTDDDI